MWGGGKAPAHSAVSRQTHGSFILKMSLRLAAFCGVAVLFFSTSQVQAETTSSKHAASTGPTDRPRSDGWVWSDFGGQVIGWAAGGAASGAVTCALIGTPIGAGAGAAAGGVSCAVGGAAYYAGTQAWNYAIGDHTTEFAAPKTALD